MTPVIQPLIFNNNNIPSYLKTFQTDPHSEGYGSVGFEFSCLLLKLSGSQVSKTVASLLYLLPYSASL